MATIHAICISKEKGTPKMSVGQAELVAGYGIKGDAHAGSLQRQVSLLAYEKIEAFRAKAPLQNSDTKKNTADVYTTDVNDTGVDADISTDENGTDVSDGSFGENLIIRGIDLNALPIGTLLRSGTVLLELTQKGKECHNHCQIFHRMGDCIMPREGVFAKVLQGGIINIGDEILAQSVNPA